MNTHHTFFRSGIYSVLAHIDSPVNPQTGHGVVLVPPFGWEDICSYRPLRGLARMLADEGLPVLRFDLPGTGDSSGGACDTGLVEAWIESIQAAAETLREVSGARRITAVGVRLGAMLVLRAAARSHALQDLVLWAPSAAGRSLVREMQAFRKMEAIEFTDGDVPRIQDGLGLEVAGFLVSPETQASLESLTFTHLPDLGSRRVLLLSRDGMPYEEKLVSALKASGATIETRAGSGYAAMTALPEEVLAPLETGRLILEFIRKGPPEEPVAGASRPVLSTTPPDTTENPWLHNGCFGILSQPPSDAPKTDHCLVFLNAGAVRHIGPNRMWVEAARRWALKGVPSVRLDLQGIGESDGEQNLSMPELYQNRLIDQVEECLSSVRSATGAQRFLPIGLCAGAFWAFHVALRHPDVVGAVLMNPRLFFWDPEIDERRALRRAAGSFMNPATWKRLAGGDIPLTKIRRVASATLSRLGDFRGTPAQPQVASDALKDAWSHLNNRHSRVSIVFTQGEPLLQEMEEEERLPPPFIRITRILHAGHTFRPLYAQREAHQVLDRELDWILNGPLAACRKAADALSDGI